MTPRSKWLRSLLVFTLAGPSRSAWPRSVRNPTPWRPRRRGGAGAGRGHGCGLEGLAGHDGEGGRWL